MTLRLTAGFGLLFVAGAWLWTGCADVNQLGPSDLQEFQTLLVQYGDPGLSPDPCNDRLPMLDGVAQPQEWQSADPLFVRMTAANGNGGDADFFLELRALWTDEGQLGGSNRIYFLVRYPDDDFNNLPDLLAYGTPGPDGEIDPSPIPQRQGNRCDSVLVSSESWTRINRNGREDQVLILLQEVETPEATSDMISINRSVLGEIGGDLSGGFPIPSATSPVDVWIWRAGRTNLHPVPQFANWDDPLVDNLPDFTFIRFEQRCGFAEDLWIGPQRSLEGDAGAPAYLKNFFDGEGDPPAGRNRGPVPDRLHLCPPAGREISEEELRTQNAGIPKDLGLWWAEARFFQVCDTLACSRIGVPRKWSRGLIPGDFDAVQGWAMRLPTESARDVRARATYEVPQDKGFPVYTLEIMRDFNTGNADDLVIDEERHYRIVIGVFDASGKVGAGSSEIQLRFNPREPNPGRINPRC